MNKTLADMLAETRLTSGALEMQAVSLADVENLANVARGEIHPGSYMPFGSPWSDGSPRQRRDRLQRWYEARLREVSRERWTLIFKVQFEGRLIGSTNLYTEHFHEDRTVSTGSWLLREVQGDGLGTQMRRMLLELAFRGLAADVAASEAWEDNWSSRRVNEKCGYLVVGKYQKSRGVSQATMLRYRLERYQWASIASSWPICMVRAHPALLGSVS